MFCIACVIVWIITFIWYFWYKIKDSFSRSSASASTQLPPASGAATPSPMVATSTDGAQKIIDKIQPGGVKWMYYDDAAKSRIILIFTVNDSKISMDIYIGDTKQPTGEPLVWTKSDPNTIKLTKVGTPDTNYYFTLQYIDPQTIMATEFQTTKDGPVKETHQIKIMS